MTAARRWAWHLLLAAFAAACLLHLAGLYWPRVDLPPGVDHGDKWAHLLGFGVPVALGWWRFPDQRIWVVAAFAAHSVISELLQAWVLANRFGDPVDALADLAGCGLGVAVGAALSGVSRRLTRSPVLDDA